MVLFKWLIMLPILNKVKTVSKWQLVVIKLPAELENHLKVVGINPRGINRFLMYDVRG